MATESKKLGEGGQTARIVVLSINDVYDMHPDEHGRGGTSKHSCSLHGLTWIPTDALLALIA